MISAEGNLVVVLRNLSAELISLMCAIVNVDVEPRRFSTEFRDSCDLESLETRLRRRKFRDCHMHPVQHTMDHGDDVSRDVTHVDAPQEASTSPGTQGSIIVRAGLTHMRESPNLISSDVADLENPPPASTRGIFTDYDGSVQRRRLNDDARSTSSASFFRRETEEPSDSLTRLLITAHRSSSLFESSPQNIIRRGSSERASSFHDRSFGAAMDLPHSTNRVR